MSFLNWLEKLFVPNSPVESDNGDAIQIEPQQSPFEWNQNMRIITAIVVTFLSAFVMWWIVS